MTLVGELNLKESLFKFLLERPNYSINDIGGPRYGGADFLQCENNNEFKKILSAIEDLEDDTDIGKGSPIIDILISGAVCTYIRLLDRTKLINKPIDDLYISVETFLFILKHSTLCSQKNIKAMADILKLTEDEYTLHFEELSNYYKIISKNNSIGSATVELLHEMTDAKTSTIITKAERIESNKDRFSLFGRSYSCKDISSSPTSFDWGKIITSDIFDKLVSDKIFINNIKQLSESNALCIIRSVYAYSSKWYFYDSSTKYVERAIKLVDVIATERVMTALKNRDLTIYMIYYTLKYRNDPILVGKSLIELCRKYLESNINPVEVYLVRYSTGKHKLSLNIRANNTLIETYTPSRIRDIINRDDLIDGDYERIYNIIVKELSNSTRYFLSNKELTYKVAVCLDSNIYIDYFCYN